MVYVGYRHLFSNEFRDVFFCAIYVTIQDCVPGAPALPEHQCECKASPLNYYNINYFLFVAFDAPAYCAAIWKRIRVSKLCRWIRAERRNEQEDLHTLLCGGLELDGKSSYDLRR